jgi:flagellar biosynthesis protein FlhA
MLQHDLSFSTAAKNYTLLAIGDGLVAQIPSLIISVAAGIVVSRVANSQDIGTQLTGQLFKNPKILFVTAGIVGAMGLIPGMPNVAFLGFAGIAAGIGYLLTTQTKKVAESELQEKAQTKEDDTTEASWNDVQGVDPVSVEVGYRLIPLVDLNRDGDLLKKIKGLRKKFAQTVGFLPPSVHIADNLELKPVEYVIKIRGVELGRGESQYGNYLAINPGMVTGQLQGAPTTDPAFGLPAVWITDEQRDRAQGSRHHQGHRIGDLEEITMPNRELEDLVSTAIDVRDCPSKYGWNLPSRIKRHDPCSFPLLTSRIRPIAGRIP